MRPCTEQTVYNIFLFFYICTYVSFSRYTYLHFAIFIFSTNKGIVLLISCQVSHVFSISSLRVLVGSLSWCFQECSVSFSPDLAEIDTQLRRPPCQAVGESGCPPSGAGAPPAPDSIPSGVRNEPSPLQLSSQVIMYRSVVVVVVLLPAGYLGIWY